jgi:hypothetical protein
MVDQFFLIHRIHENTGVHRRRYSESRSIYDGSFQVSLSDERLSVVLKSGRVHSRYFAVSAASALYHHLSTVQGIGFAPGSQKIIYQAAEGRLL